MKLTTMATAQLLLFSSMALGANHTIPDDAPNGLYSHWTDENGAIQYDYHGEVASSDVTIPEPLLPSAKFHRRYDEENFQPGCASFLLNRDDMIIAEKGLAAWFGGGRSFKGKNAASYKYGGVVTYGCDYGKGQIATSDSFLADMNNVGLACGDAQAGFISHPKWKSGYGRTQSSVSFC